MTHTNQPGAAPSGDAWRSTAMLSGGLRRSTRAVLVRLAIGVVVAAVLLYAVIAAAGGISAALGQLAQTEPGWLVPGVLAEATSYACFSAQLRRLSGPGPELRWTVWMQISLVVYGLGCLTPASPAEGIAFSVLELHRRGMTTRRAGLMLVLAQWTQLWALVLVFAIDRLVAGAIGDLSRVDVATIVGGSAFLVALTVAAAALTRRQSTVEHLAELSRILPKQRHKSRVELRATGASWHQDIQLLLGPARNRGAVMLAAMGSWVGDAACLWLALIAAHAHVGLEVVLLAYTIASVVASLPLIPDGLGAVEVAVPAVLHRFGVPLVVGLAGTLVWRAVSTFLPAFAGLGAAAVLRLTEPRAEPPLPPPG